MPKSFAVPISSRPVGCIGWDSPRRSPTLSLFANSGCSAVAAAPPRPPLTTTTTTTIYWTQRRSRRKSNRFCSTTKSLRHRIASVPVRCCSSVDFCIGWRRNATNSCRGELFCFRPCAVASLSVAVWHNEEFR